MLRDDDGGCSTLLADDGGGEARRGPATCRRAARCQPSIGAVIESRPESRSEEGRRRLLILPCSFFGSFLRGLHDAAGSAPASIEEG